MQTMLIFYLLFGLVYGLLLWGLSQSWPKTSIIPPHVNPGIKACLIVPYRNESKHLPGFLAQLERLQSLNLEIILVNDHSEDNGEEVIKSYIESRGEVGLKIRNLMNEGVGKKAAIKTAIISTQAEVILTTDVDCILPENWVSLMLIGFQEPGVQLCAGPVISKGHQIFFQRFQQIEWASILLVTQAAFASGKPLMCSAANLAYRRSAFLEVGGFEGNENIPSGDDEFLLKKILKRFGPESLQYFPYSSHLVKTKSMESWAHLLNQRRRWASKWKMHGDPVHALSALVPILIQVGFVFSPLFLCQGISGSLVFSFLWFSKVFSEKIALGKVLHTFSKTHDFFDYLKTSILHPFFVLIVGIRSLAGKGKWKGRSWS